ncbi:hypothetical protein AB0I27_06685 [Streptomyces sp. NPDC050597]|uniref:hypothetical protein n=1 Tax=Streptomyces sp. NPDC050597 TaxID=3157212 RepID=UPI00341D8CA6
MDQLKQSNEQRQDRENAQAEWVMLWIVRGEQIVLANRSKRPIYSVAIYVVGNGKAFPVVIPALPPCSRLTFTTAEIMQVRPNFDSTGFFFTFDDAGERKWTGYVLDPLQRKSAEAEMVERNLKLASAGPWTTEFVSRMPKSEPPDVCAPDV